MIEEGFGEFLVAADGGDGDIEEGGDFGDAEAREVAEFDDAGEAGLDGGEFAEGVVEDEEVFGVVGVVDGGFVEGEGRGSTAAFGGLDGAGMIDEDLAHDLGGEGEEAFAVFELGVVVADEAEPELIDEGGGLEGVIGAFAAEVSVGEFAEFVVDECGDGIEGLLIALAPTVE